MKTHHLIRSAAAAFLLVPALHAAPVSHYTFDETGGTTATDSGPAGAHGVIGTNVTLGTAGKFGTAFTFHNDATQAGIVDMGDATGLFGALTTSQAVTISVWLNRTSSGTRDCAVFLGDNTASNRYLDLGTVAAAGGVYGRVRNGVNSGFPDLTPAIALNDGQWHHVAYTVDAAAEETRLYIDGVLVASSTTTPAVTLPSLFNNFEIGRLGRSAPTDAFEGSIDELKIFDTVLSAGEIQMLAQGPGGDPFLQIAATVSFTGSGQAETLSIPFSNGGTSHPLVLDVPTPIIISGPDAAYFEVAAFDNDLAPGASGEIHLGFDPTLAGGGARGYSATLTIASNDSMEAERTVGLQLAVPLGSSDSDHDGLPDDWEIFHGLDPEDDGSVDPANGALGDPDHDGLPNSEEFFLGSDPQVNQSGKAWLPRPPKVGLMVVSAHPDDEGIFFGGVIPYYTRTKNIAALLVSMTSGDWTLDPTTREAEQRNAAWAYGLRYQPLFPRFRDVSNSVSSSYPDKIDATWDYWADGILQNDGADIEAGKTKAIRYLAEKFRRYRPEVVATHDLSGEYGHYNHMATAWAVTQAFAVAADPAEDAPELGGLPPWQIKKLYIHKYPSLRLFHDHWETLSIDDGGIMRSPREVANIGLDFHVTQGQPNVSTVHAAGEVPGNWALHPSEWWGLYASTVGPDTVQPDFLAPDAHNTPIAYSGWARGDFLENLTVFPDHDGDELPDAWELEHFGSLADADPLGDNDGDGRSNRDEFISGLDPRLPDRTNLSISADGRAVSFSVPAAAGAGYDGLTRRYRLQFSPDLSEWDLVVDEGIADGSPRGHSIDQPGTRGFYRLEMTIE
jgi:LmbE family N-acetylglucosaminyl deacetylase